ncbi:MAG: hypothetical protein QOD40_650 [Alphaproteobacteria bacterium]|jgi:hypothetical protein|nr:hypothetical protein [Alphaproteobacteria bacterium]
MPNKISNVDSDWRLPAEMHALGFNDRSSCQSFRSASVGFRRSVRARVRVRFVIELCGMTLPHPGSLPLATPPHKGEGLSGT